VEDVEHHPAVAQFLGALRTEGIRSMAFIPLMTDGLVGKFMVYSEEPRRFTEQEVKLVQAIASQVAHGVVRAQLYEGERRRRRSGKAWTPWGLPAPRCGG
jgi:GAF domain-containing protein